MRVSRGAGMKKCLPLRRVAHYYQAQLPESRRHRCPGSADGAIRLPAVVRPLRLPCASSIISPSISLTADGYET